MNKTTKTAVIVTLIAAGGAAVKEKFFPGTPPGWPLSKGYVKNLHPSIVPLAKKLLIRAQANGIPLVIASGFRSIEQQERLYAKGRTAPGPKVTNAKPGNSWHNYGLAFDVAVLKDGKPTWPNDRILWNKIGKIGQSVGLRWGGDFNDLPHFEYHPGLRIADARTGKRPSIA